MTTPPGKGRRPVYYPMFLNLSGGSCLVVGGGRVALRKVRMLREFGGDVRVVSPECCPEIEELAAAGKITLERRAYRDGDLAGARLAVAATGDDAVNRAVAAEARRSGVLVNVVDLPELSDFIVPSYVHRGDVTLAISTAGRSPALARKLRSRLEEQFGEEYAALARLVGEVRTEVRQNGAAIDGETWQAALDIDRLVDLIRSGETEKAKAALLDGLRTRPAG